MTDNHAVNNGLIAGVLLILSLLAFYVTSDFTILVVLAFINYIVKIYFMLRAVCSTRADQSGYILLNEGFKQAWLTFILSSTLVAIFGYILFNYIDPSMKQHINEMQALGWENFLDKTQLPEQDKAKYVESFKNNDAFGIHTIAFNLPFSFIFPGVLFALVIALIMKKENQTPS